MEFLITYGWAILIIAVVLGVMYQFGIFGALTTGPRASAGNCEVIRPLGQGTTGDISLEGQCGGEEPEFVAVTPGKATDYVSLPELSQETGASPVSFTVWFKIISTPSSGWPMIFGDTTGSPRDGYDMFITTTSASPVDRLAVERFSNGGGISIYESNVLSQGTWYFAALTYNGAQLDIYINGTLVGTVAGSNPITPDSIMALGSSSGNGNYGNYQIANFQEYDTALDAGTVQALYAEGIGGAPINPQYMIGWWPLNGNENDYSGDTQNGADHGATFTSQWSNGYTTP